MSFPRAFAPRDRAPAARTLLLAAAFSLVATAGWEAAALLTGHGTSTSASAAQSVGLAMLVLLAARACHHDPERVPAVVYPAIAVVAPFMTTAVALLSDDASVAGQLGLVYPVLYAAAHFRRPFAWSVAALTTVAAGVIAGTVLTPAAAVADVVVVAPAMAMITLVLLTLSEHQERLVGRLHALAAMDPLTGLATRRELESVAGRLLQAPPGAGDRRRTDRAAGVGLVLVDIDHFKNLNDTFGHPVGDAALRHVAQVVRAAVRATDVVTRWGGDELAILLQGDADEVHDRARALHAAVRSTPLTTVDGVAVTVSVGVAVGRTGTTAFADLYAAADRALYDAKAAGRDTVVAASLSS